MPLDGEEQPFYVQWLCGCGNGSLKALELEVPDYCGLCGAPIAAEG